MSTRRPALVRSKHAVLLVALAAGGMTEAADAPAPLPVDFLEYLGSWEADDADWQVANAAIASPAPAAVTPAPKPANPKATAERGAAQTPAMAESKP